MNKTVEKISFDADKETQNALKIVTRKLGRGNQAEGIRRAIISAAEHITRRDALTPDSVPVTEQYFPEASK